MDAALVERARRAALEFFRLPEEAEREAGTNRFHHGSLDPGSTRMYDGARLDLEESFNRGIELDGERGAHGRHHARLRCEVRADRRRGDQASGRVGMGGVACAPGAGIRARPAVRKRDRKVRGSRPVSRVLSWTAIHLGRTSPYASSGLPGSRARAPPRRPCRRAPLFGLAPGGVCPATAVASGAVRSYRTISPLPAAPRGVRRAVSFLWHFPWTRIPQALPGTLALRSPDFPPPAREDPPPAATVRSTPAPPQSRGRTAPDQVPDPGQGRTIPESAIQGDRTERPDVQSVCPPGDERERAHRGAGRSIA